MAKFTGDYATTAVARADKLLTTNVGTNQTVNTLVSDFEKLLYKSGVGSYSNLIIESNATFPVHQIDIDADFVTLWNATDGLVYQPAAVNLTVDITASGVNGLDTGSEAISTWYHLWVIYNPTTDTVAGLISLSNDPGVITLPSGYTFSHYVSSAYNNSSGNLDKYRQVDDYIQNYSLTIFLASGSAGTFTVVSPNVPDTAKSVVFTAQGASSSITADFSLDGVAITMSLLISAAGQSCQAVHGVDASQQFQYKRGSGTGTLILSLTAFTISN